MSENERINRAYIGIVRNRVQQKRAEEARRVIFLLILIAILLKVIKG